MCVKTPFGRLAPAALLVLLALAPLSSARGAGLPAGFGERPAAAPAVEERSWVVEVVVSLLRGLGFVGAAAGTEDDPLPPPPSVLIDPEGGLSTNSGPGIDPNGPPNS